MSLSTRKSIVILLVLALGIFTFIPGHLDVSAQTAADRGPLATMQVSTNLITWQPLVAYAGFSLSVATPSGQVLNKSFAADSWPAFSLADINKLATTDGVYTYELSIIPALDAETQAALASAADDHQARRQLSEDLVAQGVLPAVTSQSGHFSVLSRQFVIPIKESTGDVTPISSSGAEATEDNYIADDQIVYGNLCVGYGCANGEVFDDDTIKLKNNTLRFYFDDISTMAGYPNRDWRIAINDSTSGGASYFAINDVTSSSTPFKIEGGAPSNALYVEDSYGNIGLGTNTPGLDLHIRNSNTPSIRLEQDSAGGWEEQLWDIHAHETYFFLTDVTHGDLTPFRVFTGAPTESLVVYNNGDIGLGIKRPVYDLDLVTTSSEDAEIVARRTSGASAVLSAGVNIVRFGSLTDHAVEMVVNNTVVMTMTNQGNMTLQGALSEYSDVNAKENFSPVNGMEVLNRINDLPIATWNYISDDTETRHMGPMAQDFYAAFGLGADERHIASLDVNGVSLAAIQSLTQISNAQKEQIDLLSAENTALKKDLESLDNRNSSLLKKVEQLENRLDVLEQGGNKSGDNASFMLLLWGLGMAVVLLAVVQLRLIRHLSKDKQTVEQS